MNSVRSQWPAVCRRRPTKKIRLGTLQIGGDAPVSLQTMANTDTRDVEASSKMALACFEAGADIVRFAVPDQVAAQALGEVKKRVGSHVLVADIHFDYRLALASLEAGVDGLRINPGNIGGADRVRMVAEAAKARGVPIRIGVNAGSLDKELLARFGGATPEALVESALQEISRLEEVGFDQIKISVKASDVGRTLAAYRLLSERTDYPLHLGLTEAGTRLNGTVASSAAMGILLSEGIGDTIRVSLTDTPLEEVRVGQALLRALGLRQAGPNVTSCPTCGRTQCDLIGTAQRVEDALELFYCQHPEAKRPHIAVMGCVVNGPGEARDADLALVGGKDSFFLYKQGVRIEAFPESEAVSKLLLALKEICHV